MPPPPTLPACKICRKKGIGKYCCPVCQIYYCSVPCFKTHKAVECSSTPSYIPAVLESHPVISDEPSQDSISERPKKRLRELCWPEEPDEGLWANPLHRDDLKPLRGFEYEAIATSSPLRSLLTSPSLIQTLTRLTSLPRATQESSLRLMLGLPPDPAPTIYRPSSSDRYQTSSQGLSSSTNDRRSGGGNSSNYRGNRGGRGGRGNHNSSARGGRTNSEHEGRGSLESTAEERKGLNELVELVMRELETARVTKGEA